MKLFVLASVLSLISGSESDENKNYQLAKVDRLAIRAESLKIQNTMDKVEQVSCTNNKICIKRIWSATNAFGFEDIKVETSRQEQTLDENL